MRRLADGPSFFDLVKRLAELSVVLGAAFFLIGWSYLYGYYRAFGLSPSELAFPLQTVLVYSLPVLQTRQFLAVFLALLTAGWVVHHFGRGYSAMLVVVLFALVWLGPSYAIRKGQANARRDAFVTTSTLPYVKLDGSVGTSTGGCNLEDWNYLLLLRANGQIYVVWPIQGTEEQITANLRVCSFPDSKIEVTRIQVGIGGHQ